MKTKKSRIVLVNLICLFVFYLNVSALPGDLDATFDSDGKIVMPVGFSARVTDVEIQADGKILSVGYSGGFVTNQYVNDVSMVRYNADGSLDTTFGNGGKVVLVESGNQQANCAVIQPDGKIIVVATALVNDFSAMGVYRFNPNGTLDTSFGTNGKITHTILNGITGNDVVLQTDGKIVIAGVIGANGTANLSVARLNPNGTFDTSFNSVGYSYIPSIAIARAVAIQADGKIVAGGDDGNRVGYWGRFNSDGTVDGANEILYSRVIIRDIAIQADGKLVFSGYILPGDGGPGKFAIARFNANKTIDTGFGNLGSNTVYFNGGLSEAHSVIIEPDGRIIAGGFVATVNYDFALVRFNSNGFPDIGFGNNGKVTTSLSPSYDSINAMARQPDGKIIAVGDDFQDFLAARYEVGSSNTLPNRTPFDFDGDGRADVSVRRPSNNIWYTLSSYNLASSAITLGASGDIPAPADYDGDGKTDFGIYRPSTGQWWCLYSTSNVIYTIPFEQADAIPMPGNWRGTGLANQAFYKPSNGTWYFRGGTPLVFGTPEDKPLLGDFDGDGKNDPAVFRPSTGDWWYAASGSNFAHRTVHWGATGDYAVPGDYDADGKTDFVVFRPSDGGWYILYSTGSYTIATFGTVGDKPVAADFDGDGKTDIAVFRPSTGVWYLLMTTAGFGAVQWGIAEDMPTEFSYIQ